MASSAPSTAGAHPSSTGVDGKPTPPAVQSMSRPQFTLYTRFQQKVVMLWVFISIVGPFVYWPLCLFLIYINRVTAVLVLGYIAYILGPGRKQAHTPGGKHRTKDWSYWRAFVQYFNAKLVKTADLDPRGTYMFCCHPHGILCVSHWSTFATHATGFDKKFPGITVYPLVLGSHLLTPFHREFAFIQGVRSSSKESITNLLNGGPGSSVMLVIGGAEEALKSYPGTYDVILNARKGFVAIALRTGASLVPVLAFGETDLYDIVKPVEGSFNKKMQDWLLKKTGFGFPNISGVGLLGDKGLLPKPGNLTEVIGEPIHLPKYTGESGSEEFKTLVNEYHAKYVTALKALWDANKDIYAPNRRKSLDIVA